MISLNLNLIGPSASDLYEHVRGITQPRRSQIYIGYQCNQCCTFCYYRDRVSTGFFPWELVKAQVDFAVTYGIVDFEITGGEPGLYKDLLKLVRYIKERVCGRIAIITNGSLINAHNLVWDSIDEVLVSLHVPNSGAFYLLTRRDGFESALACMERATSSNIILRTNSVLGTFNYEYLEDLVGLLLEMEPNIINFLPVNTWSEAESQAQNIDYSVLRPRLKKAMNTILAEGVDVNARFMPFCDMEGYEEHVIGNLQHVFDWFDWNPELLCFPSLPTFPRSGYGGLTSIEAALRIRRETYVKSKACISCKYLYACDGVEKGVQNHKYVPIKGTATKKFVFSTKSQNLYNKLYFER